jgi:outer membrane lipoprotein-sorting protein
MTSSRLWDRAASLPVETDGRPRPQLAALQPGIPTVDELFTFMRDAELRFQTLRMRIEERTIGARGEQLMVMEIAVRHPGHARVTTSEPGRGTAGNYELWISNGEIVRTYSAPHKLGTSRPVRVPVRGLDDPGFPGFSRVYRPLTPLPAETLPDTFIHPAGYCQNVLATGRCWISGTDVVGGREAIVVECDHPRTIESVADRPDFHIRVAVDRAEGIITRLTETLGGELTRDAEVTLLHPEAPLPDSTFDFAFPQGTTMLY